MSATKIVPLGMTATPLHHFIVSADRETGEWLDDPEATGETVLASGKLSTAVQMRDFISGFN